MSYKPRLKARAKDTGEWIVGPAQLLTRQDGKTHAYIILAYPDLPPVMMELHKEFQEGSVPFMAVPIKEVDPKTICRSTNMLDCDEDEIFENDYVEAYLDDIYPNNVTRARIVWDSEGKYSDYGCAGWHMVEFGNCIEDGCDVFDQDFISQYRVIGNLYDEDKTVSEEEEKFFQERILAGKPIRTGE